MFIDDASKSAGKFLIIPFLSKHQIAVAFFPEVYLLQSGIKRRGKI
jgi:hypothetical protein